MSDARTRTDEVAPGLVRFTIDNPPINLLDPDVYADLRLLVERMEHDDELRVVVLDSALDDYFVAHLDVARLDEVPDRPGAAPLATTWPDLVTRIAHAPVVTVASVRGRCRGIGNELALACDVRFASRERALFAQPEVGFGVVPGGGGLDWLPAVVGRSRALEIALGGEDLDAERAEAYGLVNRALPDAELDGYVDAWARRVAGFDRPALATVKQIVNQRSAPPGVGDLLQSFAAISEAIARPEARARMELMLADGWGRDSSVERDHPALVGDLAARLGDGSTHGAAR
jgi:enoyl-CoA hydratase/carnithine racemase